MTKIRFLFVFAVIVFATSFAQLAAQVSTWDGTHTPWTHGTGTEADPFLIENAQQLAYLTYRVNNGLDAAGGHTSNAYHYKLMTDVDLNGSEEFQWTPIGYYTSGTDYQCFGGHFDGNGHSVSGLYINSTLNRVGFFGYTDGATVSNLAISGTCVTTTGTNAGGIIGCDASVINIFNCSSSFSGDISSRSYEGGIIGYVTTATITNCYNTGNVCNSNSSIGNYHSGGIVGHTSNTTNITNCYNSGYIRGLSSSSVGGIVGYNEGNLTVNNCQNRGGVSGGSSSDYSNYSGGIIGYIYNGSVTITNCYNTGNVNYVYSSYSGRGGIVGRSRSGSLNVSNSYYLNTCGGNNTYGGTPLSADAMKSEEFVGMLANGTCAWAMDTEPYTNDGYPVLTMILASANTYDATAITQSHSMLKGGISVMNDEIVSAGFMYKQQYANNFTEITVNNYADTMTYTLSGLTPSTSYTYKTYLITAGCDTTFGELKTFTTLPINVITGNATDITQTHVTLNASITAESEQFVSAGFMYKRSGTENYTTVACENYSENIALTLSGLKPSLYWESDITEYDYSDYVYKAYLLIDGCDTIFGTEKTFHTACVNIGIYIGSVTESSATLRGNTTIGDATITRKGFEYKASDESEYTMVICEEDFTTQIYGLTVNKTYNVRAFMELAESDIPYYAYNSFETSWLYADTIPIYDIEMLQWVADMCNSSRPASQFLPAQGSTFAGKYIKLMNNIVLPLNQPNNMSSIGSYPDHPFKGTFDGNGKLITNLYIDQPNTPYQGFFGYTLDANLYNVGLVNITASGRNYTGGMVAYAENTNMRDCYVNGGTLFALSYCGGLVGYQTPGTNSIISGCYNTCTVSGNHYVGGLLGYSDYGTVRNSYVAASVAAQGDAVGSIIGGANEVLMYNCFFSSEITGQENAIGENNFKSNEGMTNEQMRDPQFVATLNQGLTVPVWKGDYEQPINNGFPILKWQYSDIETCGAPENLTSIINGNSITLIWTGEDNVDYYIVEYGLAGEQAQTETTTRNTISFSYEQPGSYYWRVKSVCPFGESNFVNGENVVIVGIEEFVGIQQIGIYPNPASESVTIQCEGQNGLEQINVFDVNGRMVMSASATGQIHRLDISNLQQGIYFVKVRTSDGYMTNKKLIVQ